MTLRYGIAIIALLALTSVAAAGPLVPPSDLPGRERYRFEPSPLDRFMRPTPPPKPLLRWDCPTRGPAGAKSRSRRNRVC
jgi:hypothetical protein